MCGIVGYLGFRDAYPILIDGLKKLEYRGYDSAGVCGCNGTLNLIKAKGRISELEQRATPTKTFGSLGIGHTRWATHGEPNDVNAHPHLDCRQEIAVVHNGIIENHRELRLELQNNGHEFHSQTDSEVIAHLIEEYYDGNLLSAVRNAVSRLAGSYALAVVSRRHPNQLIAVRHDSPLVVGLGEGEFFLASDIPALLAYTRQVIVLEDGEIACLTPKDITLSDFNGRELDRSPIEITWSPEQAEKGGYKHFMLKEIHEQPQAVQAALRGRIDQKGNVTLHQEIPADVLANIERIQLFACGTAFHACLYGKYILEDLLDIPVEAEIASEYRYRRNRATSSTLAVVVSQSGETADTLGALRLAKKNGAKVIAITNVVGSTVAREADAVLYTQAGPEIAVASTKAYTTQLVCLFLLSAYIYQKETGESLQMGEGLLRLPDELDAVIAAHEDRIADYAHGFESAQHAFFLGRGLDYATALEGQLKLKEISYIHGEALAGGELKHGTLALIEPGIPVIALATQPTLLPKMASNLEEVQARGGEIVALTADRSFFSHRQFLLPHTHPYLMPIVTAVPLQLLAYYAAEFRGCDVDKPRNLAKSVTVE